MSEDYTTISLPKSFIEKIDEVVQSEGLGYRSRAEFVREAIRTHLLKFGVNLNVDKTTNNEKDKEKY